MNDTKLREPLRVIASDAEALERELTEALALAQERAMTARCCGILVTHEAPGQFTVSISDAVPYGITQQRVTW